jgi:hypothetical protein
MMFIVSSGDHAARKVSEILGDTHELNRLAALSRRFAQLELSYRDAVPAELSRLSRVSRARAGVLIVTAINGAAASKLRQLSPRVLEHLRRCGWEFNSMRIEVQVAHPLPRKPSRVAKQLTPSALSTLDAALSALPESPLKTALARLARRR